MSKELITEQTPHGFLIRYEGGGQVPDKLLGTWTSHRVASAAIQEYNNTKRVRKPTNGKSTDNSSKK